MEKMRWEPDLLRPVGLAYFSGHFSPLIIQYKSTYAV